MQMRGGKRDTNKPARCTLHTRTQLQQAKMTEHQHCRNQPHILYRDIITMQICKFNSTFFLIKKIQGFLARRHFLDHNHSITTLLNTEQNEQ